MKYWFYLIAILYALSPVDLAPEMFVGRLGLIDDLIVIGALYWYFIYRPAMLRARLRPADDSGGRERVEEPRESRQGAQEWDPYKVLGVARNASLDEIKHAYRELANKYHPDKVSHLGDEFKKIADKRFKEIVRAYQELTQK
ncbi:MAG: DnaJ domain-containing protein [Elusimicrobia bacterium]|nr:DnaJ domain-containing protein [Elusimicrobiota bacterium]